MERADSFSHAQACIGSTGVLSGLELEGQRKDISQGMVFAMHLDHTLDCPPSVAPPGGLIEGGGRMGDGCRSSALAAPLSFSVLSKHTWYTVYRSVNGPRCKHAAVVGAHGRDPPLFFPQRRMSGGTGVPSQVCVVYRSHNIHRDPTPCVPFPWPALRQHEHLQPLRYRPSPTDIGAVLAGIWDVPRAALLNAVPQSSPSPPARQSSPLSPPTHMGLLSSA